MSYSSDYLKQAKSLPEDVKLQFEKIRDLDKQSTSRTC